MNQTDDTLHAAAEETRQASRHTVPPGIRPTRGVNAGWLVFAAALVVVLIAIGVGPLLWGGQTNNDVAGPSITTPTTAPTTDPAADCSASGVEMPDDQPGLPQAVAATRSAIIAAATSCDLDALGTVAAPDLNTSFGGGRFENLVEWENSGRGELDTLVQLLGMPFAVQQFEDGPGFYVWPAAFDYDTWDEIPESDLEPLLAIYTQEELDGIALFGSYAGWRVGIADTGEWKFFVAGD